MVSVINNYEGVIDFDSTNVEYLNNIINEYNSHVNLSSNSVDMNLDFEKLYYEDYSFCKQLVSFEKYKKQMETKLNKNTFDLTQIKNEIIKECYKIKNQLYLLLCEKRSSLSSILLEQQKLENNIPYINYDLLNELREKYDEIWIDIKKIELTLKETEKVLKFFELTQEEKKLILKDNIVSNENIKQEESMEAKELIENLKFLKHEITSQEVEEIHEFLKR